MSKLQIQSLILIIALFGFMTPAEAGSCGAKNQRPCTIFERIPSCNKGLYEDFGKGRCLKPKAKPKAKPKKLACGRKNQRPCTILERIPSCNRGLYEDFGKGRCLKPKVKKLACGRKNQRPCTILERIPSCNRGLIEDFAKGRCVRKAVAGVDCGNANQRPCNVLERIPSCNANLKEDFRKGLCVALSCGKKHGRPCTVVERIPSCDAGLVEDFFKGACVPSADAERYRIASNKLEQIGGFISSKVGFATQIANNRQIQANLKSKNNAGVGNLVNASAAGSTQMPDGYLLRTLTIGATAGAKFLIVGSSAGSGIAIDFKGERPIYVYATGDYNWGLGLAAGGGVDVGFWVCQNNKIGGDSWGVEFGVDDLAKAAKGISSLKKGVSIAVGLWFNYENEFQGFTISPSFGVGADFGGLVKATTAVEGDDSVECDGRPKATISTSSSGNGVSFSSYSDLESCPNNVKSFRGTRKKALCSCPATQTRRGSVWGVGPYTDDSNLCKAAVHAGIIPLTGGTIEYQVTNGFSKYSGSIKNGITTNSYGKWPGSVIVKRAK